MENKPKRPLLIWIALVYLAIMAVLHLLGLRKAIQALSPRSGSDDTINLLITVAFLGMVLTAINGIFQRSSWGRRFAILCFVLMGVFSFFNMNVLLSWPDKSTNDWLLAMFIVMARVLLSLAFAVFFGVSSVVKKYFAPTSEPVISDPPPPPTFDA